MARHDDDDDENDEAVSEKPLSRRGESANGDEDDEERPRTHRSREDRSSEPANAMPVALLAAAILCLVWGGLNLYSSCLNSSHALVEWNQYRKLRAMMIVDVRVGAGHGFYFTQAAAHVALFVLGGALIAA